MGRIVASLRDLRRTAKLYPKCAVKAEVAFQKGNKDSYWVTLDLQDLAGPWDKSMEEIEKDMTAYSGYDDTHYAEDLRYWRERLMEV